MKRERNWNHCELLVGILNGAATMEDSMVVPQMLEPSITV